MKLPTIPRGLAGKIVKYPPLSEPIRPQDLEDSARSHAWKKINKLIIIHNTYMYTFSYKKYLLGEPILDKQ